MSEKANIVAVSIEDEMKRSYLDYSMSVIVSRALPDVRDGLKPVHRRILFAMEEGGYDYNKPHKKSARIVGEVMAKYHPHGDQPIYEAMARMAQDFSMSVMLVDGQGNFGSMDGDSPAAARYTEARLKKIAHELLADIDKDTVIFKPNYDGSTQEPVTLPARFPNLLANGTSGIAVGMATSIPPHNLSELIDACIALVDNPNLTTQELTEYVKGPDFPTGGIIVGKGSVYKVLETGRGSLTVRSKTEIDEKKHCIVVHEVPYQVNKARMVEHIAMLVRDKKIEGISEIRDESNRQGVRVVFDLKKDANADVVLNQLFKFSQLQTSFSCQILALVKGVPQTLSVKSCLIHFVDFRQEVIVKRTRYFLNKARERAHILIGFALALTHIDEVIELIKTSQDRKEAFNRLVARCWSDSEIIPYLQILHETIEDSGMRLSERQVNAILELKLHRLTGLERETIQNELQETMEKIKEYTDILGSKQRVMDILIAELKAIKEQYGFDRRTQIIDAHDDIDIEDLIPQEDMVITVSFGGYIKRVALDTYRSQARGGKGRSGMSTKDEDFVCDVFVGNTHAKVLFFSSLGKVYRLPVYTLPQGSPQSKGRAMVNILPLQANEKISVVLVLPQDLDKEKSLLFVTSSGNVRRNKVSDFDSIFQSGKRAMLLEDGEELVAVLLCDDSQDVLMNTKKGLFTRFKVGTLRVFASRTSTGVRGIKLSKGDRVISACILDSFNLLPEERIAYLRRVRGTCEDDEAVIFEINDDRYHEIATKEQFILTITEKGYGKKTSAYEYRTTNRGGSGGHAILIGSKNGLVVAAFPIYEGNNIILITDNGRLIRCGVNEIRTAGRRTQGVIVLRMESHEKVVSVAAVEDASPDLEALPDQTLHGGDIS